MKEKISVIVPIYNTSKYLDKCIKSILNQTYKNFELILINDGSTDTSLSICNKYATNDKRITIINKKNTGISDSRNIGINKANGKYISFIDSDDYIENNMFEELIKKMEYEQVDIVKCNANIYTKSNKIIHEEFGSLNNKKIDNIEMKKNIYRFITNKNTINCYTPLMLIKKDIVSAFDLSLKYMEDSVFSLEVLLKAKSIYFLNENLYNYRYNHNSSSKNFSNIENNIYSMICAINKIKKILLFNNLLNDSLNDMINANMFYLTISKFSLMLDSGIIKTSNEMKKFVIKNNFNEKYYNQINPKKLNILKRIEYFLWKRNYFIVLCLLLKIVDILK